MNYKIIAMQAPSNNSCDSDISLINEISFESNLSFEEIQSQSKTQTVATQTDISLIPLQKIDVKSIDQHHREDLIHCYISKHPQLFRQYTPPFQSIQNIIGTSFFSGIYRATKKLSALISLHPFNFSKIKPGDGIVIEEKQHTTVGIIYKIHPSEIEFVTNLSLKNKHFNANIHTITIQHTELKEKGRFTFQTLFSSPEIN